MLKLYSITNRRPLLQTSRRILRNIFEPSYHSIGSNFFLASTSAITQDKLDKWRKEFYSEPKNILAQNVCSRFDPLDVCLSRKQLETTNHIFTYKVMYYKSIFLLKNNKKKLLLLTLAGGNGR